MADYSMAIVDPLRQVGQGQQFVNRLFDQQAGQQAGRAFASGDYQGARTALGGRGDLAGVQNVTQFEQAQQDRGAAQDQAHREQQAQFIGQAAKLLKGVRDNHGAVEMLAAYDQLAPILTQIGTAEQVAQFREALAANPNAIDAILSATEAPVNGVVVNPGGSLRDPRTGNELYTAPFAPHYETLGPDQQLVQTNPQGGQAARGQPRAASAWQAAPQDAETLARMLVAEAGNQGEQGMAAAGWVARNRAETGYGGAHTLGDVIAAPHQFEGVNNGNAGRVDPNSQAYQQALQVANGIISGQIPDPTNGAINFINPELQTQQGRQIPAWASGADGVRIGDHVFFGGRQQAQPQAGQQQGGAQVIARGVPKPQAPQYRFATPAEVQAAGLDPGQRYQISPQGQFTPVSGQGRGNLRPVPVKAAQGVIENRAAMGKIDRALRDVAAYPDAFGPANWLGGEAVRQYTDPRGVSARGRVADIGSAVIHDRSGAAVTVSEFPRLKPFIPTATDPPAVVRQKLINLRTEIEALNEETESFYSEDNGYRPIAPSRAQQGRPAQQQRQQQPQGGQRPQGAPANARKAPDGHWYTEDPNRPGKYLRWDS